MDWTNVQEATRLAIAKALEMPDYTGADGTTSIHRVEWSEYRLDSMCGPEEDSAIADLDLGVITSEGTDEELIEFNEGDTPEESYIAIAVGGPRDFTVTVKVFVPSQSPGKAAVGTAGSGLRARMRREDVHAILEAAKIGLIRIQPTIKADFPTANGVQLSCSVTEIQFRTVEYDVDESTGNGYLGSMQAEGTLTGARQGTIVVEVSQDDTTPP